MADTFHKINTEYKLTRASIDEVSLAVQGLLGTLNYDTKNISRIRLLAEDIMLSWQSRLGENAVCTLTAGKRFNRPYILLQAEGEQVNPLEQDSELFGEWGQRLLDGLGFGPVYSYSNGKNAVRLELKAQKHGTIVYIVGAVLAAALLGLCGGVIPQDIRLVLATEVLGRVCDVFLGLLRAVAGPLVFLSVFTGICSIGDTATLGSMGKSTLLSFSAATFFAAAFFGITLPFVLGVSFGSASGAGGVSAIADMVLGMLPDNMFSPFAEGNCLQIIVLAAASGIAVLLVGKRADGLVGLSQQLCEVVRVMMSWLGSLIPLFIFAILLKNVWSGSFDVLLKAWKPFVVGTCAAVIMFVLSLVAASVRLHVSVGTLFKNVFPATLIALTTASSMAALSEAMFCCENKFGVQKKLTNFAFPIGVMFCRPSSAVSFTALVLYSMQCSGISLSISSAIMLVISVTLLLIAAPPVPGGILSCYTIVFAQFGIPTTALAAVITLDVFMEFANSAVNMAIRQFIVADMANSLGAIEKTA